MVPVVFPAVMLTLRVAAGLFAVRGCARFGLIMGGVLSPTWQSQHCQRGKCQNQLFIKFLSCSDC
jgi:hypothetical protein